MIPPKALLFDLNGTLIDERQLPRTIERICASLARTLQLNARDLVVANRVAWQSYWPEAEAPWTLGDLSGAALVREAWRRTLNQLARVDESMLALAVETHMEHARKACTPYEDAVALLDRLPPDVRFAVVSNGAGDTQREQLHWSGLEARMSAVVISGEHGLAKPDPAIFRTALDELGVSASDAWHVGDSLRDDVAGAQAAGITSVWINRAGVAEEGPPAAVEIRTLTELLELW